MTRHDPLVALVAFVLGVLVMAFVPKLLGTPEPTATVWIVEPASQPEPVRTTDHDGAYLDVHQRRARESTQHSCFELSKRTPPDASIPESHLCPYDGLAHINCGGYGPRYTCSQALYEAKHYGRR